MLFSYNQNRQFYVVTTETTENAVPKNVGEFRIIDCFSEEDKKIKSKLVKTIQVMGAKTLLRTDLIKLISVTHNKITEPDAMAYYLNYVDIKLDETVNEGKVVPGQDYIAYINFNQAFAKGDDDVYQKFGAVHAYDAMIDNPAIFYARLAESFYMNMSKELNPLVKIILLTGDEETEVDATMFAELKKQLKTDPSSISGYDGVRIKEIEQDWDLPLTPVSRLLFTVSQSTITVDSDDTINGLAITEPTASDKDEDKVKNGKKIAELEYFYMGDRADQYRMNTWPNVIKTKYLVDPEKEYYTLDVHFSFADTGMENQLSEKDILFVAEEAAPLEAIQTALTITE